ncbi:MAG: phosphatidate cytidylyltransferase [Pseudomonadota bacterium]
MFARIAAGLVGVAILVPSLAWGGPIAVDLLVLFDLVVGILEYNRMALAERPLRFVLAAQAAVLFVSVAFGSLGLAGGVVIGLCLTSFIAVMIWSPGMEGAADRVGRLLLGSVYLGGLLAFLPLLRGLPQGVGWLFVLLASTWLGDTGGFFAGRAFGRHKMAPRLSPKKTWEGFAGGFIAAAGGAVLFGWLTGLQVPWHVLLVVGAVVDIFGVLGDLAESLLKRAFGVKDSGTIMPGHGGMLDRIDSVVFAAPVLYLLAFLWYAWRASAAGSETTPL